MFARGLRKRDKSPFVKQNCPFSKESIKAAKDAVQSQIIQRARCEAEVQEAHTVGGLAGPEGRKQGHRIVHYSNIRR